MPKPPVLSIGWNPPPLPGLIPQAAFTVNMTSNHPNLTPNIFCPCPTPPPMLGTRESTPLLSQLIPITASMDCYVALKENRGICPTTIWQGIQFFFVKFYVLGGANIMKIENEIFDRFSSKARMVFSFIHTFKKV